MTIIDIIEQIRFEIGDDEKLYPHAFYIQAIDDALRDIYIWLLNNEIYTNILIQTINTEKGKEGYPKESGRTLSIKYNLIKLELATIDEREKVFSGGIPIKYCETLTEILFIPVPDAVYSIKREYISRPRATSTEDTFGLLNDFVKLTVFLSCLKTINLYNRDSKQTFEWLKQRSELVIKWHEQIKNEKNTLFDLYKTKTKPINYFYS